MLQGLSTGFNKLIERFQDQWELNPAFRTMWSVIGCAFAIVFLCSSLLIGINIANSFTKGNTTQPGYSGVGLQGGNPLNPTYPVQQATANRTTTPGANPIATSSAATPTPTIAETPDTTLTPGPPNLTPSATLDPNLIVAASQSPASGWSGTTPNQNQITNIATNPQIPNAQIDFQLNFGCQQVPASGTLDGNGQITAIPVHIPGCFRSHTRQPIPVTVSVSGQPIPSNQVQLQPPIFYATA
jgi:hypothetical protein